MTFKSPQVLKTFDGNLFHEIYNKGHINVVFGLFWVFLL